MQVDLVAGRLPAGEPAPAGLRRGHARHRGQHSEGLCLQAPVQEPRLLLPRREPVHLRAVSAPNKYILVFYVVLNKLGLRIRITLVRIHLFNFNAVRIRLLSLMRFLHWSTDPSMAPC